MAGIIPETFVFVLRLRCKNYLFAKRIPSLEEPETLCKFREPSGEPTLGA